MARGPGPDYNRQESAQVLSNTDLGELGVRLQRGFGSSHRGGHVIFATWFADGLAELIERSVQGTYARVALNTAMAQFGKQSVLLVAGNVNGNQTTIGLWVPGGFNSRLGFEVGILNNVLTNNTYRWYLTLSAFPGGTQRLNCATRIDYLGHVSQQTNLARLVAAATYSTFASPLQEIVGLGFNSLKLVADVTDPASPKWANFRINGQIYDMAGAAIYSDNDNFKRPPGILAELTFENRQAPLIPQCSVGSMILTIDEP